MKAHVLTAKQQTALAVLVAAGKRGATFAALGVSRGSNPLPALIFAGFAEYVPRSEPWRYRAKEAK